MQAFRNVTVYSRKHGAYVSVRVDLEIDLDAIAIALGKKALANKSGKSKLAVGIKAEARLREGAR